LISLWRAQCKKRSVLHLQNGQNDFEEEVRINVRGFINDDNVSTATTSSLEKEKLTLNYYKFPKDLFDIKRFFSFLDKKDKISMLRRL